MFIVMYTYCELCCTSSIYGMNRKLMQILIGKPPGKRLPGNCTQPCHLHCFFLCLHKDVSDWLHGHRLYSSAIWRSNKTLLCNSTVICFLIELLICEKIDLYINMFCIWFGHLKSYLHFQTVDLNNPANHVSPKSVKCGQFSNTWKSMRLCTTGRDITANKNLLLCMIGLHIDQYFYKLVLFLTSGSLN